MIVTMHIKIMDGGVIIGGLNIVCFDFLPQVDMEP